VIGLADHRPMRKTPQFGEVDLDRLPHRIDRDGDLPPLEGRRDPPEDAGRPGGQVRYPVVRRSVLAVRPLGEECLDGQDAVPTGAAAARLLRCGQTLLARGPHCQHREPRSHLPFAALPPGHLGEPLGPGPQATPRRLRAGGAELLLPELAVALQRAGGHAGVLAVCGDLPAFTPDDGCPGLTGSSRAAYGSGSSPPGGDVGHRRTCAYSRALTPSSPGTRRTGPMPEVAHSRSSSVIAASAVASSAAVISRITRLGCAMCCSSMRSCAPRRPARRPQFVGGR
jgi:hypothetical protein